MGDLEACLIVADGVNTVPINEVSDKVTLKIFDLIRPHLPKHLEVQISENRLVDSCVVEDANVSGTPIEMTDESTSDAAALLFTHADVDKARLPERVLNHCVGEKDEIESCDARKLSYIPHLELIGLLEKHLNCLHKLRHFIRWFVSVLCGFGVIISHVDVERKSRGEFHPNDAFRV